MEVSPFYIDELGEHFIADNSKGSDMPLSPQYNFPNIFEMEMLEIMDQYQQNGNGKLWKVFLHAREKRCGYTLLHFAAGEYNYYNMKQLIHMGFYVNMRDKNGDTPLHLILRSTGKHPNFIKCVRLLVDHGADLTSVNRDGNTPRAVWQHHHVIRDEELDEIMDTLIHPELLHPIKEPGCA